MALDKEQVHAITRAVGLIGMADRLQRDPRLQGRRLHEPAESRLTVRVRDTARQEGEPDRVHAPVSGRFVHAQLLLLV